MSRLLTLSAGERRVVVLASLALAAAPWVLRAAGLGWLMRRLGSRRRRSPASRLLHQLSARRIVCLVESTAASLPWTSTCLHRSLVAAWLLRLAGRPCSMVLGVATDASEFAAHAWLALPDEPLPAPKTSAYMPIWEWPIAFSHRSL